jgi:hypothetical protein
MLGLINAIVSSTGAVAAYVKEGLVMANKFLTPPKITHPAQGSAEFDGASDYITMGNVLNQGTGNATYCFWAYVEADSTGPCAIGKSNGGALIPNYGFLAGVFVNGSVYYFTADSNGNGNGFYTAHSGLNEWQYISIVVDKTQTNAQIYVNGSVGSIIRTGSTDLNVIDDVTNSLDFTIGAESDLSNKFDGNLANVAIWNRALSSDEINSVMWKSYDALTKSETSGLQAWYSLDDVASPTASIASMEQLAADKDVTIENKAAITAAINALS